MFLRNGNTCRLQTKIELNRLKIYLIGPNSFFFALLLMHLRGLYEIFNCFLVTMGCLGKDPWNMEKIILLSAY